ncbi:MAG TPA: glycerophosphodiester phosphodiesterase family protein [Methylomirabilota bacterium]|nr:glycerophosphodiester phosphodiesterase family protein [Methylomirabilota bacterium]
MTLSVGTILLVGCLAAMVTPAFAQAAPATLYAAHRGGSLLWPENSLLAFRNALALGADYIEFDVHLSKDGEVVVIHDPTLDRTTTGSGPVRAKTLAELRALKLRDGNARVTGEALPTLDEVVELAARSQRRMLLEIKVDERGHRYPEIEERVLAVLDRHGMTSRTVVMAFEPETWRRIRELRPEVQAGALYSPKMLEPAAVKGEMARLKEIGVGFIGLSQALVTEETVALARDAGLVLGVWTVNDPGPIRRLIEQRVGIVITDRPDLAKELLKR